MCVTDMPSYDEEENCGVISTDAHGRWHNRDCSVALPYICKKRPNATLDPFTTGTTHCICAQLWLVVHIWKRNSCDKSDPFFSSVCDEE